MSSLSKVLAAATLAATLTSARPVAAQGSTWEMRFTSGGIVATGKQRASIKDASLSTAQLSWVIRPSVAITGMFGWAGSKDVSATNSPKLDVFTSDLGVEVRPTTWFAERAVTFSPFVGAGAGARSYNYRSLDVDASHNLAGYAAAGGELGYRRIGLRIEVRDYTTRFKPLAGGGASEVRNDLLIMAGLRFNRHASSEK